MKGRLTLKWLHQNKKWLRLLLIVAVGLLVIPRLDYFSIENIVRFTPESIFLAIMVFLLIYMIKAIVMLIPISILYIAAGIVFPTAWAIMITYVCLMVALSIGYFIGKKLGKDKLYRLLVKYKRVADFLEERKDNLSAFCFMSRLLRVQFDVTNMMSGALDIPFKKFLVISLLGLSPTAIPYVIAGAYIYDPLSTDFLFPFAISIFISLIAFVAHTGHQKWIKSSR